MRDLSKLSAKQRRQLMVSGNVDPAIMQMLEELTDRITILEKTIEKEKQLRPIEFARYIIRRIQRIEKHAGLPKYDVKNPLSTIKFEEVRG